MTLSNVVTHISTAGYGWHQVLTALTGYVYCHPISPRFALASQPFSLPRRRFTYRSLCGAVLFFVGKGLDAFCRAVAVSSAGRGAVSGVNGGSTNLKTNTLASYSES